MRFQTNGNGTLAQQELQLQALEAFFLEIIDFRSGADGRNDVATQEVTEPVRPLRLRIVQNSAELGEIAAAALSIIFDRVAFVAGQRERVIGFREP
jgi:hypothetical protein